MYNSTVNVISSFKGGIGKYKSYSKEDHRK